MKLTCPGCQASYRVDDSKIPDKGIYGRCPKCQERFLITKETDTSEILLKEEDSEKLARAYLKGYIDAQPKTKLSVEKAISKDENKNAPLRPLSQLFHTIKRNKQKVVLFITAGVLALMVLFPPFHLVTRGTDLRMGYSFLTHPPHRYAKIDANMLVVQCLVVAVIGMICWLAFRRDGNSQTHEKASLEIEDIQTIRAEVLTEEDIAALVKPKKEEDLKKPPGEVVSATKSKSPSTSAPRGVGGWLLFFCVSLTIIGPLYSLIQLVQGWEGAAVVSSRFPSFETITYLETFGVALILLYGFIVGCRIWAGNPNGRRLAQQYLKIRLFGFIGLEVIVFLLLLNLPSQLIEAVATEIAGVLFREGLFFLIWWLYFKKSKRVKNTYDSNYLRQSEGVIHGFVPISEAIDERTKKGINNLLYLPWYGVAAAIFFFIIGILGLVSSHSFFGFVGLGLCAFVIWGERLEDWIRNR